MNEPIIGIDLGTTNTLAALVFDEGPEVIGSGEGLCMIPSLLSMQDSRWIAGEEARPYLVSSPSSTVYSVKRLMGRGYEELENEITLLGKSRIL